MREVILLGGYGSAGRACFREFLERTECKIILAGRNVQTADQLALAYPDRARGTYGNAQDPRTLQNLIPGAGVVIACNGGSPAAAVETAIQTRVPLISISPVPLDDHSTRIVAEKAWDAQIPVILHAGAVPGIPGILAEYLMREFSELHSIHIAAIGAWAGSETSAEEFNLLRNNPPLQIKEHNTQRRLRWRPLRARFPEPIGTRWVRAAQSYDLRDFLDGHCVQSVIYSEPDRGVVARGVQQILGRDLEDEFVMIAEGYLNDSTRKPALRIELRAPDVLYLAAAAIGTLVTALTTGTIVAGLQYPRDAINPSIFLSGLEKRGIQITIQRTD